MKTSVTLVSKRAGHKPAGSRARGSAAIVALLVGLAQGPLLPRIAQGEPAPSSEVRAQTPQQAAADALERRIRELGGTLSLEVVDIDAGAVLAAAHATTPQNPASNAKLATAAVALRRLGSNRRFLTALYGTVRGEVIPELVLRGQGDPTFTTADLAGLARELRARGVRRVGRLLVDQSYFDDQYVPPAFEQQPDEWAAFRAPTAAVSLDRNVVTFVVTPRGLGEIAQVRAFPAGFIELRGEVRGAPKGRAETLAITLAPRAGGLVATLSGTIPVGPEPRRVARRVDDPRLLAGFALRELLRELGVEAPDPELGGRSAKALLASHTSAPLAELLPALGKQSDNFVAEMLFKQLAAGEQRVPADASTAARVVTEELRLLGIPQEGLVVHNGSGLFDANRCSARALTTLLRAMYRGPTSAEFVHHLAVGGVDGTLRGRFGPWAKRRAVRAKTGTLRAAVALSGYVMGPEGASPLAFSVLVNGVPDKVGPAREAIDAFVSEIAKAHWSGQK
jgi:D-alanyl-D-alanine carboxypeptidase/D-alanyl-D-alanine-endopeptidase (penicillin-binding protein 4)